MYKFNFFLCLLIFFIFQFVPVIAKDNHHSLGTIEDIRIGIDAVQLFGSQVLPPYTEKKKEHLWVLVVKPRASTMLHWLSMVETYDTIKISFVITPNNLVKMMKSKDKKWIQLSKSLNLKEKEPAKNHRLRFIATTDHNWFFPIIRRLNTDILKDTYYQDMLRLVYRAKSVFNRYLPWQKHGFIFPHGKMSIELLKMLNPKDWAWTLLNFHVDKDVFPLFLSEDTLHSIFVSNVALNHDSSSNKNTFLENIIPTTSYQEDKISVMYFDETYPNAKVSNLDAWFKKLQSIVLLNDIKTLFPEEWIQHHKKNEDKMTVSSEKLRDYFPKKFYFKWTGTSSDDIWHGYEKYFNEINALRTDITHYKNSGIGTYWRWNNLVSHFYRLDLNSVLLPTKDMEIRTDDNAKKQRILEYKKNIGKLKKLMVSYQSVITEKIDVHDTQLEYTFQVKKIDQSLKWMIQSKENERYDYQNITFIPIQAFQVINDSASMIKMKVSMMDPSHFSKRSQIHIYVDINNSRVSGSNIVKESKLYFYGHDRWDYYIRISKKGGKYIFDVFLEKSLFPCFSSSISLKNKQFNLEIPKNIFGYHPLQWGFFICFIHNDKLQSFLGRQDVFMRWNNHRDLNSDIFHVKMLRYR